MIAMSGSIPMEKNMFSRLAFLFQGGSNHCNLTDITYSEQELSRQFGLKASTLRFLERQGALYPKKSSIGRIYSRDDYYRLMLIVESKSFGFSLPEVLELVRHYECVGFGQEFAAKFISMGLEKLEEITREQAAAELAYERLYAALQTMNNRSEDDPPSPKFA